MKYERVAIEIESPEEYGYEVIRHNLSESSIAHQSLQSLDLSTPNLTLLYNEHRGSSILRELISQETGLTSDKGLITAGATGALFINAKSQLSHTNHIVVVRPNYATNLEIPRAIGCNINYVDLRFEDRFHTSLSSIESAITSKTKLDSITCPHNPTRTLISRETLDRLVAITREKHVLLLIDETYRDLQYGRQLPVAATFGDHMPIVSKNQALQEVFLAAKEQISISGSVIDESIADN